MILKDNSPQYFQFSSEVKTKSNNANSEQYFKLIRMLCSLNGIKICQKNTLEKIFILVDAKRLLSYIKEFSIIFKLQSQHLLILICNYIFLKRKKGKNLIL